jgi:hypothetical protein
LLNGNPIVVAAVPSSVRRRATSHWTPILIPMTAGETLLDSSANGYGSFHAG